MEDKNELMRAGLTAAVEISHGAAVACGKKF